MPNTIAFNEIKDVVATTLGIQDRASDFQPSTPLLGSIPELDSMAVLEVLLAIEQRFGLDIDGTEMTGEVFETFGSFADFVTRNRN